MRGVLYKILAPIVVLTGVMFVGNTFGSVNATGCSTNSVITCGVGSISDLRAKYNSDSTKGTQAIYKGMGITSTMVNGAAVSEGTLYKNGNVTVNGKVVATNAHTAGRHYLTGSTKHVTDGVTWYERSTQVSLVSNTAKVFVFFDGDGRFSAAVMTECGNPVRATNVVVPPEPVYSCDAIAAPVKLSRNEFTFEITKYTAENGATIKDFVFDFGDNASHTTTSTTATHAYINDGTFTVTITPRFMVKGQVVSAPSTSNCRTTVTVNPVPTNPGVSINKLVLGSESTQTVRVGQEFTYTVVVENTGDITLKNVAVRDTPQQNIQLVSSAGTIGTITNNTWGYTIPNLSVGQSMSFTLTARITEYVAGDLKNTACVNAIGVPGENDGCDSVFVNVSIKACNAETKTIVEVKPGSENTAPYTTDVSKCNKQVVTELPHTGIFDGVLSFIGVGSLAGATAYYRESRKSLSQN